MIGGEAPSLAILDRKAGNLKRTKRNAVVTKVEPDIPEVRVGILE